MKLNAIWNLVETAAARIGRARARRELLSLGDRTLTDAGFSRELLEADAWPWRVRAETPAPRLVAKPRERDIAAAMAELSSYSDRELSDLGIARTGIEHAVRYGRDEVRKAA